MLLALGYVAVFSWSKSVRSLPQFILVCLKEVGLVLESKVARVLCDTILYLFRELDGVGRQRLEVRVHVIHDGREVSSKA